MTKSGAAKSNEKRLVWLYSGQHEDINAMLTQLWGGGGKTSRHLQSPYKLNGHQQRTGSHALLVFWFHFSDRRQEAKGSCAIFYLMRKIKGIAAIGM